MQNQSDYMKEKSICDNLLTELGVLYPPLKPDAKAIYVKRLMPFSTDDFIAAKDHILSTYRGRSFPSISELVDACRSARERAESCGGQSRSSSSIQDEIEEREKIWASAASKAENWLSNSQLASQAKADGWYSIGALGGLRFWIHKVFHARESGLNGLGRDLCPEHLVENPDKRGARERRKQIQNAITGEEITVPSWLIDEWRRIGAARIGRNERKMGGFRENNPTHRNQSSTTPSPHQSS